MKILGVCVEQTRGLSRHLEGVLEPAREVYFQRRELLEREVPACSRVLARVLAESEPDGMALCLPPGVTPVARAIFSGIQQAGFSQPVLLVAEAPVADELGRLMELGATDFSVPPLRLEDLLPRLTRWCSWAAKENREVRQLKERFGLEKFVGESPAFVEALGKLPRLARCDASVLIGGDTGTGKEMVARTIHYLGRRAEHAFIAVNCGAIPADLLENELFGHEAGAYTGAASVAPGLVHEAEGGTLFLDEIDSLPLPMQVKLLRLLQEKEYRPLGGKEIRKADVRFIAASNADLEELARSGRFRIDLFYRLNVLPLRLPTLRERGEDVLLLARHFVGKYAREFSVATKKFARPAVEKLMTYTWPGNVRELENVVERAMALSERPVITAEDIRLPEIAGPDQQTSFKEMKSKVVADFEASYLRQVLAAHGGNITRAALAANKNRRAFWQLLRRHHIAASI